MSKDFDEDMSEAVVLCTGSVAEAHVGVQGSEQASLAGEVCTKHQRNLSQGPVSGLVI